jgi:uncharacterized membrane protein HdeD (DUF308 family)
MTDLGPKEIEDLRKRVAAAVAAHWKAFLVQGVVLIVLGLLAVALPMLSTLAVEILIGWLFIVGGSMRVASLVRNKHLPGYGWSLAAAALAVVLGLVLVAAPMPGILSLTMVLMVLFLAEGVSAIASALGLREHAQSWGWLLISGIVDLVLVVLIWQGWPGTAAWAIGLLTGINLFFLGLSLVMLSLAVHRAPPR